MNFEVAKPKLNINIQNSLGLINLIWSQPSHSIFVCLQLFFPLPPPMWSAERDEPWADWGQRLHLSAPLIRKARSLFRETGSDKELVWNNLLSLAVLGRRGAVPRQMCASWEPSSGKPGAHAPCVAGRGSPSSSPSSSSLSGINCTLEALVTTWFSLQELPQKAEPESSTKGITSSLFLRFFFLFFF